jgi:hypothetical protein
VLEIAGQWRSQDADTRDWQAGCWWEHGYVRRIELPENANWVKMQALVEDDVSLEIKIPKHASEMRSQEPKES